MGSLERIYILLVLENICRLQITRRPDHSGEEFGRIRHVFYATAAAEERGGRARHVDPGHGREQAEAA